MFVKKDNGGETCTLAAVVQRKCTSVLVEMEKNAHSQSNTVSFAVHIFLSGQTGGELCLLKNVSQPGEDLKNLQFRQIFVFTLSSLSSVLWGAIVYMACLSLDEVNSLY